MPLEVIESRSWIIIHGLFLMSLIVGLLGKTGFYARFAARTGWRYWRCAGG